MLAKDLVNLWKTTVNKVPSRGSIFSYLSDLCDKEVNGRDPWTDYKFKDGSVVRCYQDGSKAYWQE